MKVKELIKLLEANGWQQLNNRGKGSYRVFKNIYSGTISVIPGKDNDDLKKGTERSIKRQTGLH